MTEVKIPFLPRFKEVMLNGKKTMTSRTRKYGEIGDTFKAFEATFQLTNVEKLALFYVANNYYREEGLQSKEEFIEGWEQIHPRKGYDSNQIVWVHVFKKME